MEAIKGFDPAVKSGKVLRLNRPTILKLQAFVDREILEKSGQLNIFDTHNQGNIFEGITEAVNKQAVENLKQISDILHFMAEENLEILRVEQHLDDNNDVKNSKNISIGPDPKRP